MSLKTWKNEFYSLPIYALINPTDLECVNHSILKWSGALPENLKKHKVSYEDHEVYESSPSSTAFYFGGTTCALCNIYFEDKDENECYSEDKAEYCPIVRLLGRPCDRKDNSTKPPTESIYDQSANVPEPMLNLLKQTRDYLIKEEKS